MEWNDIKFRAWNPKRKTMHYFSLYSELLQETTDKDLNSIATKRTTMRYTGMKDNKGKEIFEGDIVRNCGYAELCIVEDYDGNWIGRYFPQKIKISEEERMKAHYIGLHFYAKDRCAIEVVGNIYESPKLL